MRARQPDGLASNRAQAPPTALPLRVYRTRAIARGVDDESRVEAIAGPSSDIRIDLNR
jgi:hypothetical protein